MPRINGRSETRLTVDITERNQTADATELSDDRPFVIVVLGDFHGAAEGVLPGLTGPQANRQLIDIDRDNFDDVLAHFGVRWGGMLEGLPGQPQARMPVQLAFRSQDDFHPDRIAEQLAPLRSLVEMRRALEDPTRFDAVAAEVRLWAQPTATEDPQAPAAGGPDLLNRILDQSDVKAGQTSKEPWPGDLRRFLEHVVRPYLVKIDTAQQAALVDAVDQALSQQVRAVLHHPGFQRLEATWRGLRWLVYAAETGVHLKIRIVHITKDELRQDLAASPTLEESGLSRLLLEPASVPGSEPAALLIGNYEFAHTGDDLALLKRLGAIAQRLRAPFVAAVSPHLLGCVSFTGLASASDVVRRLQEPSFGEWHAFRRSPEAHWVALALPRFLLRLPYGIATEPAGSFAFEEQVSGSEHEQLLWGNPALAVAAVVAEAFAVAGGSLDLSERVHRLEGLPLYVYQAGRVALTKPCAEVLMSGRVVEALEEAGLVPLVSYRDADMIALPCLQSLAEPRSPLRWVRAG